MTTTFLVSYIIRTNGNEYTEMTDVQIDELPSKTSRANVTMLIKKAIVQSFKKRYEKSIFMNVPLATIVILNWWSYTKNYSLKEL